MRFEITLLFFFFFFKNNFLLKSENEVLLLKNRLNKLSQDIDKIFMQNKQITKNYTEIQKWYN